LVSVSALMSATRERSPAIHERAHGWLPLTLVSAFGERP
jgi:hypothetical protein